MIVLDTTVISELIHERAHADVLTWAGTHQMEDLFLCIPVIAEMAYGGERMLLRDGSRKLLAGLDILEHHRFRGRILPCNAAAANEYGRVVARREAAGRPIGPMDALIAAICIVHGATLATRNVRDFDGLDLKLVNPFEAAA